MKRVLPLASLRLNSLSQRVARLDHYFQARFRNRFGPLVAALAAHIPAGSTVLDVGANHGKFTRHFARIHGGACHVIAFEPLEYNHSLLARVVRRHRNVETFQIALADREGAAELFVPIRPSGRISPGSAHLGDRARTEGEGALGPAVVGRTAIVTETLDGFIARHPIERLGFIKLDVQGAEALVLRGGMGALGRDRPPLWCELCPDCHRELGLTVEDTVALLRSMGYGLHTLDQITGEVRPARYEGVARDYLVLAGR